MGSTIDINYLELLAGYILMLIPLLVFWHYKTGLVKSVVSAIVRMTIQLLLVGVYLEYIFKLNSTSINILWVVIMLIISTYTIINRSGLSYKMFSLPIFFSGIISVAVVDIYFLGVIVKLDNIFYARYFIPITGLLLGNTMKNVIIALDTYFEKIKEEQNLYRWHLANGASHKEALMPFMRDALKKSFNPLIATTAIMGLISLPGMMTGQILEGSNPNVAVKYQIMLLITIFSSSVLNVIITLFFSNKIAFDKYKNLKHEIFRTKKQL